MKILGLIPARYASTRFPGKPLALIAGRPMVQWVFQRASEVFEHTHVATDDERIADAVRAFGGRVVMTSDRHRSGTDRCAEALAKVQAETAMRFDVVVNIQGDEPFIQAEQLRMVSDCFGDASVQIATLAKAFEPNEDIFNPNTPKVILNHCGEAIYFSRTPIPFVRGKEKDDWRFFRRYYKHIGLYAYRADVLEQITRLPQSSLELAEALEQLRWIENGYRVRVVETTLETLAVDTPEDLERVKLYAASMLNEREKD